MAKLASGLMPRGSGAGETQPYLLLSTAADYAEVAGFAIRSNPSKHIAPIYMLTGLSLELCLKAFILHKTGDELKITKLGHRLRDIWDAAINHGLELSELTILPTDFEWMIDSITEHHQKMTFRYMPDVEPFIMKITPKDMVIGAKALCGAVYKYIDFPDAPISTT